eukprot:9174568-Lingulodinium_polyedra.AAC.1
MNGLVLARTALGARAMCGSPAREPLGACARTARCTHANCNRSRTRTAQGLLLKTDAGCSLT